MVLVLFVLMLLNLKDEPRRRFVIVRAIIAITIGCWIFSTAFSSMVTQLSGLSTHTMHENMRRSEGTVKAIGEELFSRYIVQFELSSLVLLIGIVGAVMLAKRKQVTLAPRNEGTGEKERMQERSHESINILSWPSSAALYNRSYRGLYAA